MHKKSSNRSFGILFFLVFLGFGLWPLTNEMSPNIYLIIISVIFLILGLLYSKLLSPLNNLWIKFGEILATSRYLLRGIKVKKSKMLQNLEMSKGSITSEAIMFKLGEIIGKLYHRK